MLIDKTMKRLCIIFIVVVLLTAPGCVRKSISDSKLRQGTPTPTTTPKSSLQQTGLINDFAGVFDSTEKKKLDLLVMGLKRDADVEFVVVTVDSTNGQPLFDYSLALARDWRPGGVSGRGLVLVLAIKDRQWRLQVSEALRTQLPDEVSKELGDRSVELYRQGKYAEGVERYITAIGERLKPKV